MILLLVKLWCIAGQRARGRQPPGSATSIIRQARTIRFLNFTAACCYYAVSVFRGVWLGPVPVRSLWSFKRESPASDRAFHTKLERRDLLMILLLVKLRCIAGRITAMIVWSRKRRR